MKNIAVNLHDLRFDNCFLNMTSNVQKTKETMNELNLIKIKNFCASKNTMKIVKLQSTK